MLLHLKITPVTSSGVAPFVHARVTADYSATPGRQIGAALGLCRGSGPTGGERFSTGFVPASLFSPLCHIKSRGQAVERVPRRVDGESPKIGQAASRACTHAHGAQPQRLAMTLATRCADAMVVVRGGDVGGAGSSV